MALTLTIAPAVEPLDLSEVKAQSNIDTSADDALLTALITTARRRAESFTRRALITQTWEWRLDQFPLTFRVPFPPLQSVASLQYVDTDGNTQMLSASEYTVDADSEPGRVVPAYSKSWPSIRDHIHSITLTFKAGYGDAASDVPAEIKQAMLMMIAHWYENREATITGQPIAEIPYGAEALLWPYKVSG